MTSPNHPTWKADITPAPWMAQGACRDHLELFDYTFHHFDRHQDSMVRAAIAVCNDCPVRTDCLDWAIDNDQTQGIWGGLTPNGRHRLVRERSRGVA